MSILSQWIDRLKGLVNHSKEKDNGEGIKQDNDLRIGTVTTNPGRRMAFDSACTISQVSDRGDIRVYEEGLATSCNAHSEYSERTRREAESERLVSIAKANGHYKSHAEFASLGMKYLKRTGESVVSLNVINGRVYKYRDPFAKGPLKGGVQPEDVIYEHLVHNKYFPETAYRFEGISDEMGDLRILLSQDFIECYAQPSKAQIEKALSCKGLYPIDKYTYGNDEISVTDLSGDNTLIGINGEIYFIDPIINFHRPAIEILDVEIREIRSNEIPLLTDFLYEAIFQPDNNPKIPRTVLQEPMIWAYVDRFGTRPEDFCLVALVDGKIVGAAWSRNGCSYGKVDDTTPELAISLYPEYRNKGIGSRLLASLLEAMSEKGFDKVSLSVDKTNYAVEMYRKLGFEIISEREHDYLMIKTLKD